MRFPDFRVDFPGLQGSIGLTWQSLVEKGLERKEETCEPCPGKRGGRCCVVPGPEGMYVWP